MAQLDNAADSDSEERGFESLWAGQKSNTTFCGVAFIILNGIRTRSPSRVGSPSARTGSSPVLSKQKNIELPQK
mgnify:CR=1 FL=1